MSVKELGRLKGLIPATFTPLLPDGELNLSLIPAYLDHLKNNQIEYIFINGTTGEGPSFTVEERKEIAETWFRCAAGGALKGVMVHVGAGNLREACDLAQHAENHGAVAVSAAPTTYFKPSSVVDLIAYCKAIAAAAPTLPFYYYHIPGVTGCQVAVDDLYARAVDEIPSFRGIKFSSTDVVSLGACLQIRNRRPNDDIFWGVDEASIIALDHGIEGCIGSTYNMMAPASLLIMELQRKGDRAAMMEWLFLVQDLIKSFKQIARKCSFLGVMKAATSVVTGLDLGPTRLPLAAVGDRTETFQVLEKLQLAEKMEEARAQLAMLV